MVRVQMPSLPRLSSSLGRFRFRFRCPGRVCVGVVGGRGPDGRAGSATVKASARRRWGPSLSAGYGLLLRGVVDTRRWWAQAGTGTPTPTQATTR